MSNNFYNNDWLDDITSFIDNVFGLMGPIKIKDHVEQNPTHESPYEPPPPFIDGIDGAPYDDGLLEAENEYLSSNENNNIDSPVVIENPNNTPIKDGPIGGPIYNNPVDSSPVDNNDTLPYEVIDNIIDIIEDVEDYIREITGTIENPADIPMKDGLSSSNVIHHEHPHDELIISVVEGVENSNTVIDSGHQNDTEVYAHVEGSANIDLVTQTTPIDFMG